MTTEERLERIERALVALADAVWNIDAMGPGRVFEAVADIRRDLPARDHKGRLKTLGAPGQ